MSKSSMWGVKDLNARVAPRVHEAAPGVTYSLKADEFMPMPAAHAAAFLKDPAFMVVNADGEPVSTVASAAFDEAGKTRVELEPGQVIANIEELTVASLLARARAAGGDSFSEHTKRATLVAFLMGDLANLDEDVAKKVRSTQAARRGPARAKDDDGLTEDMDEQDAAKILEGG